MITINGEKKRIMEGDRFTCQFDFHCPTPPAKFEKY